MYIKKIALILVIFSSLTIGEKIKEDIDNIYESRIEIREEKEIIEITEFQTNGLKLKEGIASEQVLRVKHFLKEMGYMNMLEGYYFDGKTREVVIKYQKSKELKSDGIIGKNTYEKINEDMELKKINIPEIKLKFTEEVPKKDWIMINKDSNTLYHLHEKETINKYPVATGKSPSFTPEGKFSIVTKYKNPAWGGAGRYKPVKGGAPNNPLGKRWMGLSIRGGGVYGIHGNSAKESIGRFISLGCIRMFNEDVEFLYDLIAKGTPVWIGSEIKLNEYGVFFTYME